MITLALVTLLLFIPHGSEPAAATQARGDVIPGRYIVVFNDGISSPLNTANVMAAQRGLTLHIVFQHAIKGFAATVPANRLNELRRDPRVAYVVEDRVVTIAARPTPTPTPTPPPGGQSLPTGINRIEGDLSSAISGNGSGSVNVPVAVIDTGINLTHPDLNVAGGKNCNGRGTSAEDGHGHGTHVAGTIGAKDNAIGVVGMAPGTPLYAVRVLNNAGSGTDSQVICGIDWVTANAATLGIKVANMSLGGVGLDDGNCGLSNNDPMHTAICNSVNNADVTYVVAAGNDGIDYSTFTPAAYNEVLTVTALADFNGAPGGGALATCRADVDDTAADFSNFTTTGNAADVAHTIAGPGVCILSTWDNGTYNTISGTSMASPHLAGTAALCIGSGACAGLDPPGIIAKLRADAAAADAGNTYGFLGDPNSPIGNLYYGYLGIASGY